MTRSGLVLDDRYRLDDPIAAGGAGQVWRAADLLLERPVAVKVLRPEYAGQPETLRRFHAEARHAGSLNHPCIARVYDYGHAGPSIPPYLVMEYVNGPSLADMLAVDPVTPVLAMNVVAQAAAGLDAAHRSGLVHRDVKPGNILIGANGLAKITDFGIAHAAGSAPITSPGLVMGTTQYIAPERIAGAPGTPASDLYSMGIVIYECLTGMPPFRGTAAQVLAEHLYRPLPPLPPCVPPELDRLVAWLTVKDPAARLSDAGELAAIAARLRDSLAARTGQAATTAMAGAALRTQAARPFWARRRRAALTGAIVLTCAGVAGLMASGALHSTSAADHPPASRHAATVPVSPARDVRPASAAPHSAKKSGVAGGAARQRTGHGKGPHGGAGGDRGEKSHARSGRGPTADG